MITTTMYLFQGPTWQARAHAEYGNSWGWAAFVWNALLKRYASKIQGFNRNSYLADNWPLLWEQEKEIPFESWERNVLRATYDRAILRGLPTLARIAGELRRFKKEHWRSWDGVCHLDAIAHDIEILLFNMGHTWVPTAIGFQATSCAMDLWHVPIEDDPNETRPYSLLLDKLHHEVELVPSIWDR